MRYPNFWQKRGVISALLAPLGWLVCLAAERRRLRAPAKQSPAIGLRVPVIVVGNITVGGTGKTPLLLALIDELKAQGYHPGVVSRGYGATLGDNPVDVAEATSATDVGDEPWLIRQDALVPVVVHPERLRAAQMLLEQYPAVDLLLSDDGLQHHHLPRTVEIVVVDGARRFGNNRCLPAGPLREPLAALDQVDFVAVNGRPFVLSPTAEQWHFGFRLDNLRDLAAGEDTVHEPLSDWQGRRVQAVAGIGNPERFFETLRSAGMTVEGHALDDHQAVDTVLHQRLMTSADPVVITAKDAVKWPSQDLRPGRVFVAEGRAELPAGFTDAIMAVIRSKHTHEGE